MAPFQKILAPVDFSPPSTESLRVACDLARTFGAPLTIFHCFQPTAYPMPDGFLMPSANEVATLMVEGQQLLDKAAARAREAGVAEVSTELVHGAPFAQIVAYARQHGHDLIVVGTHGWTGLRHALLGSVAEKVVRKAHCAVLTIRAPGHEFEHP